MNIWILKISEPIELGLTNQRLYRSGLLARKLIENGHKVTIWTSNMDHIKKTIRQKKTKISNPINNFKEIQLAGRLYTKNISLARIGHNIDVSKEFTRLAVNEEQPDIVVCNFPIIELAYAGLKYCKMKSIPYIVDVRDFWPDIFYEVLPKWLKFIGLFLFFPWESKSKKILRNASGITGITEEAIHWARNKIKQNIQTHDKPFPLAYIKDRSKIIDENFLIRNKINYKQHSIYCYIGSFSNRIELETIANAAKILESDKNNKIRLVICGEGEQFEDLYAIGKKCSSLIVPGWIEKNQINTLLNISKAGILPYKSSLDFMRAYPNKVGEYLSAGLPILSSVQGAMKELLSGQNCGLTYQNRSPESFLRALKKLEDDEKLRKFYSQNAIKCFKQIFDANVVYKDYAAYVESFVVYNSDKK